MAELDEVQNTPEADSPPIPFFTVLSTFIVLLFFAVAVIVVYREIDKQNFRSDVTSGEESLKQMRDTQKQWLDEFGDDALTKSSHMPIDLAIERLAKQKGSKGSP